MTNIQTVLAERATTHGDYKEQAAFAQQFKRMMRAGRNWERLDYYQAQSMEAFCDKASRILSGNFNEIDHWRDVAGYATLVVQELEALQGLTAPDARPPVGVRPRPGDEPLNAPEFLTRMQRDLDNPDAGPQGGA
jgi:hypothetical protein